MAWLRNHLDYCTVPLLGEPWVLDIDTTIKPLYGHQEGAEVGYNPHKPGRASHCYHTYWLPNLRLLLSKTDIAGHPETLLARLAALNPGAPLLEAVKGEIAPHALFAGSDPTARAARLASVPGPAADPFSRGRHAGGIETVSLRRDRPIPALALAMWLQALAEHCGARLLRLKGLVEVDEQPNRPAIIHAVQHVVSPPEWLPQWPSADHCTRIVIIAEDVPRHFPARLLDAIEEEVRGTTTGGGIA